MFISTAIPGLTPGRTRSGESSPTKGVTVMRTIESIENLLFALASVVVYGVALVGFLAPAGSL